MFLRLWSIDTLLSFFVLLQFKTLVNCLGTALVSTHYTTVHNGCSQQIIELECIPVKNFEKIHIL